MMEIIIGITNMKRNISKCIRRFVLFLLICLMLTQNKQLSALEDINKMQGYSIKFFIMLNLVTIINIMLMKDCLFTAYEISLITILLGFLFYGYIIRRINTPPTILQGLLFVTTYSVSIMTVVAFSIMVRLILRIHLSFVPQVIVSTICSIFSFYLNRFIIEFYFKRYNPGYKLYIK